MNEPLDPRHERRVELMQTLFALMFTGEADQDTTALLRLEDARQILAASEGLDEQLRQYAPERPLTEINQIDLAIMRLILHESQTQQTPKKVLINEAVELAKAFGTETSPKFVNGVLGKALELTSKT